MVAASNDIDDLLPLVPSVLTALAAVRPGDAVEVLAFPGTNPLEDEATS